MSASSPSPAYPLVQEGLRHQRAERPADAASCYERALELDPKNFDALQFLGVVRFRNGDCASGIALIERALTLHPNHPSALNNLGNALRAAGRLGEALAAYRRAVALARPPSALYLRNLGSAQLEQGEWAEAAGNLRCAAAMAPGDPIAWCWLGHLSRAVDDPQGALDAYGKALALDPRLPEAHRGMACVFRDSDRPAEARAAYGRALELAPQHLLARLLHTDTSLCIAAWDAWSDGVAQIASASPVAASLIEPMAVDFLTDDPTVLRNYAEAGAAFAQSGAPSLAETRPRRAGAGSRVRIGYLSGDIREHPVARLLAGVIERHDRMNFEVTVYALGKDNPAAARRRIMGAAEHFVALEFPRHQELAERIASDEQDILIDLMGHTARNRTQVLAAHPAPVQATWLGYPGTLGGTLVDYLITDPFTSPPGCEPHYAEHLVRLPESFLPGDSSQIPNAALPRSAHGLSDDATVLCSFNQTRKINPPLFDTWMEVLRAVPSAVLWLTDEHPLATANLRQEALARGVAGDRIVFSARAPSAGDYLARYQVADLALDTFPYNSHSTAADALWAGCPIATLAGRSFPSRVCGSLLRAAGMAELVTESAEQYRDLIISLARDGARRAAIRERLAAARDSSPLFDTERFTRTLERAYLLMHERATQGLAATHLWIE